MGARKYFSIIVFSLLVLSCRAEDKVTIRDCRFIETGISISIDLRGFSIKIINFVELQDQESSERILFENECIEVVPTELGIELHIDATGKVLATNRTYDLVVKIPGGFIFATIFIGDPVSVIRPTYTFPGDAEKNIKIIILKQSYAVGI